MIPAHVVPGKSIRDVTGRRDDMKIIKQTTYETCLASVLLMLISESWSRNKEIEIWKHGWEFNYLIGQLNYVAKKYKKNFVVYIENRYYFKKLQKEKSGEIKLVNSKIDIRLIEKLFKSGSVIVYLDNYYLRKIVHAPHFVLAEKCKDDTIEIADPYDGKRKKISGKIINKAIISLRNHLKYSPVLIRVR